MKGRLWVAMAVAASVICVAPQVRAQGVTPESELERGAELASQEKFEAAVTVWLGIVDELKGDSRAKAYKYLGVAFKRMGMLPESWHYLTLYLEASGKEDVMTGSMLEEVEGQLKHGFVKVTIACDPSGAQLRLPTSLPSGLTISQPCPLGWWFLPGKHTVHAEKADFVSRDVEIDVRERGDSGTREIVLTAVAAATPTGGEGIRPDVGGPTTVTKPAGPEKPSRAAEWTLIGSGLALGAAGAVFHGLAYSKNEDLHATYLDTDDYPDAGEAKAAYDDARSDEVRPKEIAAYVFYGVGGAALVAGIVTWAVRKPDAADDRSAGFTVMPLVSPDCTGAMMTLEW